MGAHLLPHRGGGPGVITRAGMPGVTATEAHIRRYGVAQATSEGPRRGTKATCFHTNSQFAADARYFLCLGVMAMWRRRGQTGIELPRFIPESCARRCPADLQHRSRQVPWGCPRLGHPEGICQLNYEHFVKISESLHGDCTQIDQTWGDVRGKLVRLEFVKQGRREQFE